MVPSGVYADTGTRPNVTGRESPGSVPLESILVSQTDGVYAYGHLTVSMLAIVGLLIAALNAQGPGLIPFSLAIGLMQYRLSIVLHDCTHLSLFKRASTNMLIGTLVSAALFTTFTNFRAAHMAHHRHYRTDQDPSRPDYEFERRSPWGLTWFILQPLVGFGVILKLWQFWQIQRSGEPDPSTATVSGQGIRPREIAAFGVVQLVLAAIATGLGQQPLHYPLLVVLPAATVLLFLSRLRTLLEHGEPLLGSREAAIQCGRTTLSNWLEGAILSPMNFNYHYWHHKYPGIPSSQLPKLHAAMTANGRFAPQSGGSPIAGTFTATLADFYRRTSLTR